MQIKKTLRSLIIQTKNIPIFLTIFFSPLIMAHSQSPMDIKKIVYNSHAKVKLEIGNLRSRRQEFEVYIDGVKSNQKVSLQSGSYKRINVRINNIKPDIENTFDVCTLSIPLDRDNFKSKICTTVKLYYPLSRLQQHYQ